MVRHGPGIILENYLWAASSENIPSRMRKFRSSCACAKYPGLLLSIHSVVFIDSVSGQWRSCAQAALGLRCPHMPEDTGEQKPGIYVFARRGCLIPMHCYSVQTNSNFPGRTLDLKMSTYLFLRQHLS